MHICTPNASHVPYAVSMEAGKHVSCEKPLGISLEDASTQQGCRGHRRSQPVLFAWFHPWRGKCRLECSLKSSGPST